MAVNDPPPVPTAAGESQSISTTVTEITTDYGPLHERIRLLERRLLSRDPSTHTVPSADQAPETQPNALDQQILASGQGDTQTSEAPGDRSTDTNIDKPLHLTARVAALKEQLSEHVSHRQPLNTLWAQYEACRPILKLGSATIDIPAGGKAAGAGTDANAGTDAGTDADADADTDPDSATAFERSVLSADVKANLILEAEDDWTRTLGLLAETKDAQKYLNPAEFQQVPSLIPRLQVIADQNLLLGERATATEATLESLLDEYNSTIHTLSRLFLHWDQLLDDLETRVSTAERHTKA